MALGLKTTLLVERFSGIKIIRVPPTDLDVIRRGRPDRHVRVRGLGDLQPEGIAGRLSLGEGRGQVALTRFDLVRPGLQRLHPTL